VKHISQPDTPINTTVYTRFKLLLKTFTCQY